ncbi:syntaxin-1B, putative [Entamoeba invadens IP1]|uniref:Syntaxin-1B, putative n=1 Tax=Entamoeba invadens IP1 TaxID=370355 RepID=A0A0A1TYM1_ENTIV|nr:syntaxin-1B, putative [Entamoeba invadens IP1]ELP86626.1 syntaxin-1B, putative [Entamoeba invadens IP1]|eukprot:XP_004185972.1 syntaxin-1B, putative [Entamoeba invadens IP1]
MPKKEVDIPKSTVPEEGIIMQEPNLRNFLLNVEEVRRQLQGVQNIIEQFRTQTEQLKAGNEDESNGDNLKSLVSDANKFIKDSQTRLSLLRDENTKLVNENRISSTIQRIRKNHVDVLCSKLIKLSKEYRDIQEKNRVISEEKVARQMKIVNPNVKEEEIKEAIESNDNAFMTGVMTEKDKELDQAAKQALAYITAKHNDILILVGAIAELRQMFEDLSILVSRQGEVINKIEENCETALEYVKQGTQDLVKAHEDAKASSKFLCIGLIVVAIVMVIIVLAILAPIIYKAIKNKNDTSDGFIPFL